MKNKVIFWLYTALFLSLLLVINNSKAQQTENLKDNFIKYAKIQSVTGRESQFVEFLKTQLPDGFTARTDNLNNLIVQIGEGEPDVLVIASIDEPGYIISKINEDGYLNVQFLSGSAPNALFHQFHEGHFVDITTAEGIVNGIVAIPSSHIFRGRKPDLSINDFIIDVRAESEEEVLSMGISVLDPVTAVKDIAVLQNNRVAGPMLSRKFPAFALMEALKTINISSGKTVVFAWTTQSLQRNSGAARLARQYSPKKILLVGAFQQQTDRETRTTIHPVNILDSGVLIPDANLPQYSSNEFLQAALSAALKNNIKTTISVTGNLREASAFRQAQPQVVPAAIPVKNPGSLVEVIDLDDLEELIKLIELAIEL